MEKYLWEKSYPKNIDWNTPIEPRPLYSIIDDAAGKFPKNIAIDFLGKKYSYSHLLNLINRAAEGFRKIGVKKGVNIGLLLPNCPQFVISFFAILKAGGTVVSFSPLMADNELKTQIKNSEVKIIITLNLDSLYPKLEKVAASCKVDKIIVGNLSDSLPFPKNILFPIIKRNEIVNTPSDNMHMSWNRLLDNTSIINQPKINPTEDIAALQYTGGTTGVSKGAILTHSNLYSNVVQCTIWLDEISKGKEKMLGVLPFFHIFALTTVMNMSILNGAKMIMHPRFILNDVLADIHKKKPTLMPGVPTMYTAINSHKELSKYNLSSLKACISGGAPLPLEVKNNFEKLTSCTLVEGYGLTETSPVACANPLSGKNKELSVGLPLPNTIVKIEDIRNRGVFLDANEDGEICIKGPQVMSGYWNRPEETKDTFVDGFFRTGDIGYVDEDGYVFIVDRLKELIIASGFNIYPRHVEEAIYKHSAVEEVAVIGIPDKYRGQTVKAFIALKEGRKVDENDLKAFLASHLAKYKIPTQIEFRKELPKTMIGKISKKDL